MQEDHRRIFAIAHNTFFIKMSGFLNPRWQPSQSTVNESMTDLNNLNFCVFMGDILCYFVMNE